ncbi:MAG: PQQ-binding-like beta-propeller repeat protein [Planctomycetia bacterium]|nr:PQQ-binding-like beta-propeller repeat protein [Planctomycetia bacterium]
MQQNKRSKWYRRGWVILTGVVIVVGLLMLAFRFVHEWRVDRELAQLLSELDQKDPNWKFEKWNERQPVLNDNENLAFLALNMKSKVAPEPIDFSEIFFHFEEQPARQLNADQISMLQSMLIGCKELPAEMQTLLQAKTGTFPFPDHRQPNFKVLFQNYGRQQDIRTAAYILQRQSMLWSQEKKHAEAVDACRAILHLARALEHEPGLVNNLVAMAMHSYAVSALERTLAMTDQPLPTKALEQLQQRLLEESQEPLFRRAIVGERAIIDRYLREVAEGRYSHQELVRMFTPPWNRNNNWFSWQYIVDKWREWTRTSPLGYLPEERLNLLRHCEKVLAIVDGASPNSLEEIMALDTEVKQNPGAVSSLMGGAVSKVFGADIKRQTLLKMGAALLAAERYRLATGKVPTGWNDLVPSFFPAIPIDPYDQKPVRWKNTDQGFMLYSVWMDQKDDGGRIRHDGLMMTSASDFGVEFFAPAHRRQPPTPAKVVADLTAPANDKEKFFAAARAGDVEAVKTLLDAGLDVNTKTEYGATALCFAAERGHLELMKLLLDRQIDLKAKDTFYSADAITWAAMKDQHEAVALLLKSGATGETSLLSQAIFGNKPKMVAAILSTGRIKQESLDSSLASLDPKKTEIAKLLADAGAKAKPKEPKAEEKKTAATPPSKTDDTPKPLETVVEPTGRANEPRNWPGFRGESNAGVVDGQFPPTSWNSKTGKHLAWKTPIPGLGLSCPVVWGNQLFVTTAINLDSPKPSLRIGQYGDVDSVAESSPHVWKVYCLDATTGNVLWEQTSCTGVPKTKRHMKSSHANATPATDGRHVVVNFGSEGLYCYSMDGRLLWKNQLGKLGSGWFFNPDYEWGFGSSPIIFGDNVIVQCDIGKNSFIAAYSLQDGSTMWQTPRDEIPSWCSPTVVYPEKGKPELVTVATKFARGYDPYSGEELWKLGKFSEIAVPTPFYAKGLIYLTTGYRPIQPIFAVKPGARGDITLEKGKEINDWIAWSKTRGGPYLPTPLVYGDHLYVCSNNGVLSCYEASTGKVIYQKRLGGANGYTASLVAADGRIYCTDEEGLVRVVKAGPEFQLLALNPLDEECLCHPAISNGTIFFRTRSQVQAFRLPPISK